MKMLTIILIFLFGSLLHTEMNFKFYNLQIPFHNISILAKWVRGSVTHATHVRVCLGTFSKPALSLNKIFQFIDNVILRTINFLTKLFNEMFTF